jgi:glyoxylase-like metal-dependent hydrolase (beta-lactamase superfamily II)
MAIGDVAPVEGIPDCYYLDTGMYDTEEYGAVYIYDTERPALVDTGIGTNYERVLDALDEVGIEREELDIIAPTHVHLDHAGGAGFLAAACPNADVYVPERGATHLIDPERLWEGTKEAVGEQIAFYTEPEPVPADRIVQLLDGDRVDLGDRALDVYDAPGHAPHQAIFHDAVAEAVFTADAAGIYVPELDAVEPTSPPPTFDFEGCIDDVRLQQRLEPETLCYAHFGPTGADDRLTEYADVLTDWVEAIAEKRVELDDDEAVIQHFVEATTMADVWGERKARAETAMNVRGVLTYLDRRAANSS